jgi:TRAP-type C4-dicarboxylate transport system permease small subunit
VSRLRALVLGLDRIVARIEAGAIAFVMLLLTIVTFAQVVSRYVFNDPLIWSEEAARYLFVWVSMLGAALGLREGAHYGLDAVRTRLPRRVRLVTGTAAAVIVATFLVVLLMTGIEETQLASMQYSATLPMRMHWAYLALPVGAALMLLHLLAHLTRFGVFMHPLEAKEARA